MSRNSTESPVDELAGRAREWRLSEIRAVCDVLEPWAGGLVMKATRYPSYFVFNAVLVQRAPGLSAEALAQLCNRELAGLAHRCIEFSRAADGLGLRDAFKAWGWERALEVWMKFVGERPAADAAAGVVEVPFDAVDELRRAWHEEDFPGVALGNHLADAAEVARRRDPLVLAVHRDGHPIAYAQLERDGDAAEISGVYVHPAHRGRGIGTALTRTAVALAPPVRDLWIKADAEDRPQHLYARLGFQSVTRDLKFLRLPEPELA